jgi:hypothetical protein
MIAHHLGPRLRAGITTCGVLLGSVLGAHAQTPAPSAATAPANGKPVSAGQPTTGQIDVSRLPVGLSRIQRQLRRGQDATTRTGLNLSYLVQVYAPAPPLVIFTEADRLTLDLTPRGAPTHAELFTAIAPTAHRASTSMAFRRPASKAKKSSRTGR